MHLAPDVSVCCCCLQWSSFSGCSNASCTSWFICWACFHYILSHFAGIDTPAFPPQWSVNFSEFYLFLCKLEMLIPPGCPCMLLQSFYPQLSQAFLGLLQRSSMMSVQYDADAMLMMFSPMARKPHFGVIRALKPSSSWLQSLWSFRAVICLWASSLVFLLKQSEDCCRQV